MSASISAGKRKRPAWLWVAATAALLSITGCGMYPSKAGAWPKGFWGDILKGVSHVIDVVAHWFGPHGNYGLAIIIVTVAVRLIIFPLFLRQMRFSRQMQSMQPRIQEIRARHKGDNQKIQQETMKLYQEAGFNPMAGCLPMLIQLPILYALFGALRGNIGLQHGTFLHFFILGQDFSMKGSHWVYFVWPLLAGITTFLSSRVMMTGPANDPQQRMMLLIMPLFVLFMATRFPTGLSLYWIVSNMFTAVQGYFVKARPMQAQAAAAGVAAAAVKPRPGPDPAASSGPPANRGGSSSSAGKSGSAKSTGSGGGRSAKGSGGGSGAKSGGKSGAKSGSKSGGKSEYRRKDSYARPSNANVAAQAKTPKSAQKPTQGDGPPADQPQEKSTRTDSSDQPS